MIQIQKISPVTRNFSRHTAHWDGLITSGPSLSFKGWEADKMGMTAIFQREGDELHRLSARAVDFHHRTELGQLGEDEHSDATTLTINRKGEVVSLFPLEELKKATSTYLPEKSRLMGAETDFGAHYMAVEWVTGKPRGVAPQLVGSA